MTLASAETTENCLWVRSQANLDHTEFVTNARAGDSSKCSSSLTVKAACDFASAWPEQKVAGMSSSLQATRGRIFMVCQTGNIGYIILRLYNLEWGA